MSSSRTIATCLAGCLLWVLRLAAAEAGTTLPGDRIPTPEGEWIVHPIQRATFALGWQNHVIYVDPVGGANRFAALPRPDLVLITDIHGDHFSVETLQAVCTPATRLVAPPAVAERIPDSLRKATTILTNGASTQLLGLTIQAVPMYNLTPERLQYHPRGRGNGYLITAGSSRVYISGDTEDIPEMRSLRDIHIAFVCMNLPYTMSVEQAADAVRSFRPRIVYPYHYRGSDLERFRALVGQDAGVEIRLRDWYRP